MYDYLRGRVVRCEPTSCVLDVGGVGYALKIPVSTYERLRVAKAKDAEVTVLCRLQLLTKQDEMRMFGFATESERRLFDALLKVSGVGPASALAVLSGSSPADVVAAIGAGDSAFLIRVKGIGKKTAARVIVELKEKAHLLLPPSSAPSAAYSSADQDAVRALISLGYSPQVGRKAVDKAAKKLDADPRVEDLIKEALRHV